MRSNVATPGRRRTGVFKLRCTYFRAAEGHPGRPVLLTVPEACAALRISRWTFYELVRRQQLQTLRIGTRRLVPGSAIDELIDRLRAEASS